ncbi:hypothetical protein EVAR_97394_1 [Eumeta japonica]|uniref:Uncharacterized protein n=1 Tax=Eumeta variegata TaxID=151549 RepID=A0A4C1SR02_EUMVA|nr:hypothetical protein EVAR_97394_1 [Eumeta japonica]
MCGFQDERDDNLEEEKEINKDISESVGRNDTDKLNSNNDIEIDEDMDKKKSKDKLNPTRFADEFGYYCISVNYCDAMSPENFRRR